MKVFYSVNKIRGKYRNAVVALGVFDGLHVGHQRLIKKAVIKAKKVKGTSCVMTFYPHPVQVLRPEVKLSALVPLTYRLKLIEKLGVDVCIVINFTKRFSQLSPVQFIQEYLVKKLAPFEVFVGYDFRFGKDRMGNLPLFSQLAQKFQFKVSVMQAVQVNHETVSSTRIRTLVQEGKLKIASQFLGRPVSVVGVVQPGDKRGKGLGFPTANIYPMNEMIPPCGVYAVYITVENHRYKGMANVGFHPTFPSHANRMNVEVNIFDFQQNIYGQEIIVEFIEKIRDEKVFYTKESLINQLFSDGKMARRIFAKAPADFYN